MVSLPEEEKKDDSTSQDLFQTPTEGSLLASSEEQQPPVAADEPAVDGPRAPELNWTDDDEAVDLGNDSDPFASITELCHVSASQEEHLRHCGFAPGRDGCSDHDANEDSDDPTQPMEEEVESTGIVMVSLPETPDDVEEKKDDSTPQDLFQTPTEGSLLASSEEQQSPVAADDPAVDGPRAPEPTCTDGDEAVDLGKDS